jgi:RimJ/RimL family protein N-acetyltransferase
VPPIPLPDPELTDAVVRLRAPGPEDVPALVAACQDPLIDRFTPLPSPYTEADARVWVDGAAASRESGEALNLIIAPADGDAVLGTVGLLRPDWTHRTAEVGYLVAPEARGAGVAARAARLLATWGLTALRLARVSAEIDADNAASQRAAQRAGFTREGVLRSAIEVKGRRWSLAVYSLLPEDLT